jgi:hypothetical protein
MVTSAAAKEPSSEVSLIVRIPSACYRALKQLEKEHREMNNKTTAVDQQVSNITMDEVSTTFGGQSCKPLSHDEQYDDEAGKVEKNTKRHGNQIQQIEKEILLWRLKSPQL